ncbi:MAG: dihydrolipoyl dehydrogenase [Aestuariivita sp.]|nr:dihydrolipoyl dehydrogenase [Aestuariivita sp.]MCY4203931.1 dihydrolipoyl dehydrogenase [Aestuariivita sp.]
MKKYDVIVIGSGPAGYVCAIRCSQLGLRTACVEGRETLGGTCLNVGCIPSKALLHASHMLHEAKDNFGKLGIKCQKPAVDWQSMRKYKEETISQNTRGIEFLFKKNKVDWLQGWGSIPAPGKVAVGKETFDTTHIVIASGSEPTTLKGVDIDEKRVVSSTGALELAKIPKKLTVIGAGVIGLELGSVYSRLGSEVTILEYLDAITPGMDQEIQKSFLRILTKQGLKFILGAAVQTVTTTKTSAKTSFQCKGSDSIETLGSDVVLVATGRKPVTRELGLETLGIACSGSGQIQVDDTWQTNIKGIYAIGDCVAGPMLAHKGEDEGMALAEHLSGARGHVDYNIIPSVIYTHPEVASVGMTGDQLKATNQAYKVGKFNFMGNGRAKANFAADGFVKILADKDTDRILGCHIIGPSAGDLIHEVCVAMEFGASAEDLALTCHAHPTYSEAVREAALACGTGAIHA